LTWRRSATKCFDAEWDKRGASWRRTSVCQWLDSWRLLRSA